MDIQRFVHNNDSNEKIFHSNAYARVAHGSSLGSSDVQSFDTRRSINRNRRAVGHYGDSLIGRGDMREAARDDIKNPLRQSEVGQEGRQQFNSKGIVPPRRNNNVQLPPRQGYREPPARGYNPFS